MFPWHKRTIALYQKPVAFPADDAVQHMEALMAEKDHIHGLQLGLGTGVQHDLVALVAKQREHGMSLQAEADRTAFGYLRLHPGEEQVIGYLLHFQTRFYRTGGRLLHRADRPDDRTVRTRAAC